MGIEEVLTAPRSPWQNPFAERVIGSIRRECLDQVIVLGERHLRGLFNDYLLHYHRWRCHRSLDMDVRSLGPCCRRSAGTASPLASSLGCDVNLVSASPKACRTDAAMGFSGRTAGP